MAELMSQYGMSEVCQGPDQSWLSLVNAAFAMAQRDTPSKLLQTLIMDVASL